MIRFRMREMAPVLRAIDILLSFTTRIRPRQDERRLFSASNVMPFPSAPSPTTATTRPSLCSRSPATSNPMAAESAVPEWPEPKQS